MATVIQSPKADAGFSMADTAFFEFIDRLLLGGGPDSIITFHSSDAIQNRAYELVERQRKGRLTDEEEDELEQYRELEHFVQIAKVRARMLLQNSTTATNG